MSHKTILPAVLLLFMLLCSCGGKPNVDLNLFKHITNKIRADSALNNALKKNNGIFFSQDDLDKPIDKYLSKEEYDSLSNTGYNDYIVVNKDGVIIFESKMKGFFIFDGRDVLINTKNVKQNIDSIKHDSDGIDTMELMEKNWYYAERNMSVAR